MAESWDGYPLLFLLYYEGGDRADAEGLEGKIREHVVQDDKMHRTEVISGLLSALNSIENLH